MNTAIDDLYTSPKLLFELAAGVEPLDAIADRYELDEAFLRELVEKPNVKRMLSERRKELEESGYTLAQKAKLCFEDLLGTVYTKARAPDASLAAVLSAAEFFRKVAGLDKREIDIGAGDKFSITINIGGAPSLNLTQAAKPVIDVEDALDINQQYTDLDVLQDDTLLALNNQFEYAYE